MKLTFLGTCSGTEPMAGYRHSSFVIEHEGGVYWFDAGESCSYHGHLGGIDLLGIRAIFISHPHMDHIGGLANLLWTVRKLDGRADDPARKLNGRTIPLYFPDMQVWGGFEQIFTGMGGNRAITSYFDVRHYQDGVIHEDKHGLRVTARHNRHMGEPGPGEPWRSFSFRIEADGRAVVFSGDLRDVSELQPLLEDCDLLLMETGHHKVEDVCRYLAQQAPAVGRLGFTHHGRAILADPEGELSKARQIFGPNVFIAREGMTVQPCSG